MENLYYRDSPDTAEMLSVFSTAEDKGFASWELSAGYPVFLICLIVGRKYFRHSSEKTRQQKGRQHNTYLAEKEAQNQPCGDIVTMF